MSQAAGQLRHRIQVEHRVETQDPNTGAVSTKWEQLGKFWARVTPLSGREIMAASAEYSSVSARIRMRYRDDINSTMRIVHRNRVYNIRAVLPDSESGLEWLTLLCGEGVNEGN